jgi:hypothetical protein
MDKSQKRILPRFAAILLLLVLIAIFSGLLTPRSGTKAEAQIFYTQFELKDIASALKNQVTVTGSLSKTNNAYILQTLFGTNTFLYSYKTNADGKLLDAWETPINVEILSQTSFTIRSAGPNKKFGDADDIIFNSVSNDFVKP